MPTDHLTDFGSSPLRVGTLFLEAYWIEVQSTEIEVNRIGKPLFVSESSCANFDHLDPAVHAFRWAITDTENDGIYDAPQMILNGLGRFFHGSKSASHGPG